MRARSASLRVLAILAVTFLALGLRLQAVDGLPIDYDEDDYVRAGQHYAAAMRSGDVRAIVEYDYNLEHPPLHKLIYGAAFTFLPVAPEVPERPTSAPPADSLPGPHLEVARLVSAGFGTLTVLLVSVLNPLAGFFLAIHTFTIKYTSQVYLEALPAMTSALAAVAYSRSQGRWNRWLVLSAACLGLTVASKYIYAVVGVAIGLHALWEAYRARLARVPRLGALLAWGAVALGVFLAADPFLWADPVGRLVASVTYNTRYAQGEEVARAGFPIWQPLTWLAQPVPWHPGVFTFSIDLLISLLAILGARRLWRARNIWAFWLVVALVFLLLWPTKWPQYVLVLTVPLSLAAAYGFQGAILMPLAGWARGIRARARSAHLSGVSPQKHRPPRREALAAIPWLLPGVVVLGLIAGYPMLFQGAMSLTDFSAQAIRDGLTGGVWREAWLGLTRQIEPTPVSFSGAGRVFSGQVHYAGTGLLRQILLGGGNAADFLVFDALWTVLSVGLQTVLGVYVALLLHRRGVRFAGWWRTLFILPWAIPEFVGAMSWAQVFEPRFGMATLAGQAFHERIDFPLPSLFNIPWQSDPDAALVVLLISGLWYGFPLMMLAASAGLKLIPQEVYAAAALDGAGVWGQFRWVTWPLLLPLLAPAMIVRAIFAFNQFYLFYVLQPPWPDLTAAVISFFTFSEAGLYAVSAAVNLVTVIFLVALILGFNRLSKASEGVTYA